MSQLVSVAHHACNRFSYRVAAIKYTEQHYHRVLACIELLYVVFRIMLLRYFADVYSVYEK